MLDRWQIVRDRKPADFVYAVRTTGVFCRPGCASRLPRRDNVRFFDTPALATLGGFRPCKRCRPAADLTQAQAAVLAAARAMPDAGVADLAADAGLSTGAFSRMFRQVVGLSPRAYAQALRAERTRAELAGASSVTSVAADFGTSSRFYEHAQRELAMAPTTWRDGGRGETLRVACAACALGRVLVAATSRGLCAIQLGDNDDTLVAELRARLPRARIVRDNSLARHVRAVAALIREPAKALALPLDVRGTAFQRRVWDELVKIPPGQTRTYTQVAKRLGKPKAVRAVASACAANLLAVAIPCHRVKRGDGSQGGYRWGVKRKVELQGREGVRRGSP